MKHSTLVVLKTLVWIGCLMPLCVVAYELLTNTIGPDPAASIASDTGLTALWMLAILLAITPVRRMIPKLNWLIKFRRLIGLFVFFYATIHLLNYLALYVGFDPSTLLSDITKRLFVIAGFTAWLLMVPLALTSTVGSIRRLGGKNWNRLHKLVYLTAICADVHYWWKVKPGVISPAPFTLVLTLLLLARPVMMLVEKRRKARPVAV